MAQAQSTYFTYRTAHGPITICANAHGVTGIAFDQVAMDGANKASELTNAAATQLQEYLAGKRRAFDVPIDPRGSAFQLEVWTEVCNIPYGQTRTAADVATALGKPGSHRAVGTAIKQCTLAPIIPVHRVLAASATGKQAKILRGFQALEKKGR